jgi:hypothetical protein
MSRTPGENKLAASIAANMRWAKCEDRTAATAPARQALEDKFLREADGDPKRAENLKRAHYQRAALKSSVARRKAKGGGDAAA